MKNVPVEIINFLDCKNLFIFIYFIKIIAFYQIIYNKIY